MCHPLLLLGVAGGGGFNRETRVGGVREEGEKEEEVEEQGRDLSPCQARCETGGYARKNMTIRSQVHTARQLDPEKNDTRTFIYTHIRNAHKISIEE